MKAYSFDENGFYKGEVIRQKSPLEQDVWLMPANATDQPPPTAEGFVPRWIGTGWELIEIIQEEIAPELEQRDQSEEENAEREIFKKRFHHQKLAAAYLQKPITTVEEASQAIKHILAGLGWSE